MLEAAEIDFTYGGRLILDDVCLSINAGERVLLAGNNGSGKTTLLSILSGRLKPPSGRISWLGENVTRRGLPYRARQGICFLPQHTTVLGQATVSENLSVVRELLEANSATPTVAELLVKFDLLTLRDQRASRLSGGERRRLELARTFLTRPRLLLLDEPFAGLDSTAIDILCELLQDIGQEQAIVLTDHQGAFSADLFQRRLRLESGRLLEEHRRV